MSAIGWYRRRKIIAEERLNIVVNVTLHRQGNASILDRAISIILFLAILGTIVTLSYALAKPTEGERITEFYILGREGKADGYPREITVDKGGRITDITYQYQRTIGATELVEIEGDSAKITVGITNKELEPMCYQMEILIDGLLHKKIGPKKIEDGQKWEEEVSFSPTAICASTTLLQEVGQFYGPQLPAGKSILVLSTEHLEPGDYIWVGTEPAQVQAIDDNLIILEKELNNYHPVDTQITETKKIDFRLYKIRQLDNSDTESTSLSIWLGKENLDATIVNQGKNQALYQIEVRGKGKLKQESTVEIAGPEELAPGEEWKQELDYSMPSRETQNVEFILFRDGELLYKEKTPNSYPSLHLWIHIKENV